MAEERPVRPDEARGTDPQDKTRLDGRGLTAGFNTNPRKNGKKEADICPIPYGPLPREVAMSIPTEHFGCSGRFRGRGYASEGLRVWFFPTEAGFRSPGRHLVAGSYPGVVLCLPALAFRPPRPCNATGVPLTGMAHA